MRIVKNVVLGLFLAAVGGVSYVPRAIGADMGTMIPAGEIVF